MRSLTHAVRRALARSGHLRAAAALLGACAVAALAPWPGAGAAAALALLLAAYAALYAARAALLVNARIQALVGPAGRLAVHTKFYPGYKWVDLCHSGRALAGARGESYELPAPASLSVLKHSRVQDVGDWVRLRIGKPDMLSRPVSATEEEFLPDEVCWCVPPGPATGGAPLLVRVCYLVNYDRVIVEVAARTTEVAQAALDELAAWAGANSIYRNRMVRVSFEATPAHRFGDQDHDGGMSLRFLPETPIADDQIILDDLTRSVVEHTVVDFHRRRARLMQLGLPGKRGVLFYGPPGTGKTYTSAYLAHRLHDATKVIVAGKALLRMADVCAVASSLQPALVILEDVDLVFTDRELAPNTTLLGEFLDQLDGFAANDQIIFILTTNVLERVEAAIKDRPGRVSQCIYFGPPSAELRARYLAAQTRTFDVAGCRFEHIVAQTDGVSQAFLKELVLRAAQIASARTDDGVALTDSDFDTALREMTAAGGRPGRRIIGFQVEERER